MTEAEVLPAIAYVDEKEDELSNFFNDATDSGLFRKVHTILPKGDLSGMTEALLDLPIEALVTDFNLSESYPVPYSGEELVEAFLKRRAKFPCFIRTSFEKDALNATDDVNLVYSKNPKADSHNGSDMFERISLQIARHRRKLEEWQQELGELLAIPAEERTSVQIERLLNLDGLIEANLGGQTQIPRLAKEAMFKGRDELIEQTERLIKEIKSELGELPDEQNSNS